MKIITIISLSAVMAFVAPAGAAVITFDGLGDIEPFTSYTEGGFIFEMQGTPPTGFLCSGDNRLGSAGYGTDSFSWYDSSCQPSDAQITMSRVGGGTFDLLSYDSSSNSGSGLIVSAVGKVDSIDANNNSWATYAVNWINVDTVIFSSTRGTRNAIDNINVADVSSVPIPAAVWLFGSGLGLLGWMRRKA